MNIPKIPIGEILSIGEKLYLGAINSNIEITQKKDNFFVIDSKDDLLTMPSEERNTKNLYFAINDSIIYSFVNGTLDENIKPTVININIFENDNSNAKFWYNSSEGTFKYRNLSNEIIDLSSIINLNHSHLNKNDLDKVSGTNTGDETRETIISKIGYEVAMNVHDHANISGNSNTTNKLKTPITTNGISFDGSDNIEIKPSNIVWNYLFRTVSDTEKDTWNNKQGKNTDLTAILELTETSGLLRKNGQGVWALDNSLFATEETAVMKTGDQTISGKKTFNDETTFGNVIINGNIIQNGLNYETHAEKVFTKNDQLILRDGAITGLGENEYTGLIAKLYDGVNDGQLVFDKNGIARVGDLGTTQALATREDSPVNGSVPIWNDSNKRFETSNSPTTILGYKITDAVNNYGDEIINGNKSFNGTTTISGVCVVNNSLVFGKSAGLSIENYINIYSGYESFGLKFTNSATGQTVTDGVEFNVLTTKDFEIRQRENAHINVYVNNAFHTAFYNNGTMLNIKGIITYGQIASSGFKLGGNGFVGNESGVVLGAYTINSYVGSAAQSMFKFSNLTTGQTATDGTDIGITSDGTFEIRNRENLGINFYTNNTLVLGIGSDGIITGTGITTTGEANKLVKVNSNGAIVLNGTSTMTSGMTAAAPKLIVANINQSVLLNKSYSNISAVPAGIISVGRSRGATVGTEIPTQSGDALGYYVFEGVGSSGTPTVGATIEGIQYGNATATSLPTYISIKTSNGTSLSESMRITSEGTSLVSSLGISPTNLSSYSTDGRILNTYKNATNGTYKFGGIFADTYRDISSVCFTAGMWFESTTSSGVHSKTDVVFGAKIDGDSVTLPTEGLRLVSSDIVGTAPTIKLASLAGVGQRGVVAGNDGSLGTTGVDFIFSNSSLTSTPQSTGININGYGNGKIIIAYLSGQWDSGNATSSALIMIRCGYDGNNFSSTVISSDNYIYPVTFTQVAGILYVSATVTHGVRIRFIEN